MALGKPFSGVKSGMSAKGLFDITIIPLPIILVGQFGALAASVRTFRVPLERAIKHVVIPSIRKNFAVEGRPAWTELADQTIYNRARDGFSSGPILRRTGKMERAATALARWKFTKDTAFMGGEFPSSAQYAPIHQIASQEDVFGGVGGTAYLPGRPFAVIQDEDQPKIEAVFARWFTERAAKVGLAAI